MLDTDIAWRLTCLRHQIQCEAAAQKFLRLLREIRDRRLEEKYSPSQPRAPRGTPTGGQWIDDPASARQRLLRETYLIADLTPDGQIDPGTFRPANEDSSPLAQVRQFLVQRTAEFLDTVVQRQQEDPEGLEDVLKVARLLDPSDLILSQVLSADQKARIAELVDNAAERLKPYLDDVAARLETGRVDDETALFLTAGAIIAVGKYAPKAAKTRAFARIGTVLRRITARLGAKRLVTFPTRQLDRKFKHAVDFGVVTAKKNQATLAEFEHALRAHMADPATVQRGTYGYVVGSKVYYNPNTLRIVVVDRNGAFNTAFELEAGSDQFETYIRTGYLR